MKQQLTAADFNSLAICNKTMFCNGEKQKFSGVMNKWYFINNPIGYDSMFNNWFFVYKQPLIKEINFAKHGIEITTPFCAYGQRILVFKLSTKKADFKTEHKGTQKYYESLSDDSRLRILSGDDDIFDITFDNRHVEYIKKLILENYNNVQLPKILHDYIMQNQDIEYN